MKVTLQYWLSKDTDVTIVGIEPAAARAHLDTLRWERYELTNQTGYTYESQSRYPNPVDLVRPVR